MAKRNHEEAVARRAAELAPGDFRALERKVTQKRLAWLEERGYPKRAGWRRGARPVTPREAFEIFFFDYLELDPEGLTITEDSDTRITWHSTNACPTLDACAQLGLGTRAICGSVYEKPTQLFFSRLDPALRFVRSYSEMRPLAPHCRESIVRLDIEDLMRQALDEAQRGRELGGKGYGAVLVMGDQVIAREHDSTSADGDPSRHAELKAICKATARLGTLDLRGALLVSTCEPCPMCAGLAVWANVTSIIYGSSIEDTAAMGRTRIMVGPEEIAARSPYTMEVLGGLLKEECDSLYA